MSGALICAPLTSCCEGRRTHSWAQSAMRMIQPTMFVLDMVGYTIPPRDFFPGGGLKGTHSRAIAVSNFPRPSDRLTHGDGSWMRICAGDAIACCGYRRSRVIDPGEAGGCRGNHRGLLRSAHRPHPAPEVGEAVRFYSITALLLLPPPRRDVGRSCVAASCPLTQLRRGGRKIWQPTGAPPSGQAHHRKRRALPLVRAIEAALARLDSFAQQRRFTSDAAHELKTDVGDRQIVAAVADHALTQRGRYQAGLELCFRDCMRLESTVQQMLTLARVDRRNTPMEVPLRRARSPARLAIACSSRHPAHPPPSPICAESEWRLRQTATHVRRSTKGTVSWCLPISCSTPFPHQARQAGL